jgi:hypothetical protein
MKQLSSIIIFAIFILSCNVRNIDLKSSLDPTNYKEDINKLVSNKLISTENAKTLNNYIAAVDSTYIDTVSISYSQLLSEANNYFTNLKLVEEKKSQLNKAMSFQVTRKYTENFYDEGYMKNFLLIDVKCTNNTNNKISGFGVDIYFLNKNGETIYSASWPIDKSLNPNSTKTIPFSTGEYKNTNKEQSQLKVADLSKLTVVTALTSLTYDDGTSIVL